MWEELQSNLLDYRSYILLFLTLTPYSLTSSLITNMIKVQKFNNFKKKKKNNKALGSCCLTVKLIGDNKVVIKYIPFFVMPTAYFHLVHALQSLVNFLGKFDCPTLLSLNLQSNLEAAGVDFYQGIETKILGARGG